MSWSLSEWIQNLAALTVLVSFAGATYDWARHPQGVVRRFFKWLKLHIIEKLVASPREIARLEKRLDELAARLEQQDEAAERLSKAMIGDFERSIVSVIKRMQDAQDGLERVRKSVEDLRGYTNSLLTIKDGDTTSIANMEQVRSWIDQEQGQLQRQIAIVRDYQQRELNNINETLVNVTRTFGTLEGTVRQLEQARAESGTRDSRIAQQKIDELTAKYIMRVINDGVSERVARIELSDGIAALVGQYGIQMDKAIAEADELLRRKQLEAVNRAATRTPIIDTSKTY